jgi:hypothetical protein
MELLQTLIGGLIGGGLIGFIEFLIRRRDERNDKNSEVLKKLERIEAKINTLEAKVDSNEEKRLEGEAVQCRVRILRFIDEVREGRRHTKDSFDQCHSDITVYERYCKNHPEFKNNQTASSIEYFDKLYAERLEKNDFL